MKNLRPVYSQNLNLRLGPLVVQRLRLNRHLPEANWISDHAHPFVQILLYMGGSGVQHAGRGAHPVKTGALLLVPPKVHHSFAETEGRRPLCLAIDIGWRGPRPRKVMASQLTSLELGGVRKCLSSLTRWREGHEAVEPREAAAVLQLIDIFFRSLGLLARTPDAAHHSVVWMVQRALNDPATSAMPLAELAKHIGYQKDYLNRLLKQSQGMSLGQLRAAHRVERAKKLLATSETVAEAALQLGFEDPNYFTRWFRKQTGLTPGDWRKP